MSNLALQVKDDIVAKIKNDQLVLPTLPEIALQVQEIAEDAATTIPQLTKIIAQDPAMTARIIKVTNSPLIRTSSPVTDLNTAISRLGIDFTSNLCVGLAMEQMFQATHDIIDKRMRSCWSSCLRKKACNMFCTSMHASMSLSLCCVPDTLFAIKTCTMSLATLSNCCC